MKALCFRDNVGSPIDPETGKIERTLYMMGQVYDIDPKASWAIWFKDPETGKRIKEPPPPEEEKMVPETQVEETLMAAREALVRKPKKRSAEIFPEGRSHQ